MKVLIISSFILLASCTHPTLDEGQTSGATTNTISTESGYFMPSELLKNKNRFQSKQIKVLAYYFSHHDGDWIAEDRENRFENTISIPRGIEPKKVILKSGNKHNSPWELDWSDGTPVLIEGTFRHDGESEHMGLHFKDVEMLYPKIIQELSENEFTRLRLKR